MKITPTVPTAALAGIFSAAAWPLLWPLFKDPAASSSLWLVAGTLLFIALPAHAFVVGFSRSEVPAGRAIDGPLLKRVVAWLVAAGVTAALMTRFASPVVQ
jgi:hypothetical protein